MNKKILCAALLGGLSLANHAMAQEFDDRWYLTGSAGFNLQDDDRTTRNAPFLGLGLGKFISPNWSLDGELNYQNPKFEDNQDALWSQYGVSLDLRRHFIQEGRGWNPYIVAGLGMQRSEEESLINASNQRRDNNLAAKLQGLGAPAEVINYGPLTHEEVVMALSVPFRSKGPVLADSARDAAASAKTQAHEHADHAKAQGQAAADKAKADLQARAGQTQAVAAGYKQDAANSISVKDRLALGKHYAATSATGKAVTSLLGAGAQPGALPKGYEKKLVIGAKLDADLAASATAIDTSVVKGLAAQPKGTELVKVGDRVVRVDSKTRVVLDVTSISI